MKYISNIIFSQPKFNDKPSAWIEHIPFAFLLIELTKPKIFVELGTHYGNSYFAFCQAINQLKLNTKAYAVDHWLGDEHTGSYSNLVFDYVKEINDDNFSEFSTLLKMPFNNANTLFSEKSIDLIHIDGTHTYEAVKLDFETWLPKMSDSGIIIFHDTQVKEKTFGVYKLFNELKLIYPSVEFNNGYGLGLLYVGTKKSNVISEFMKSFKENESFITKLFENLGKKIELIDINDTLQTNLGKIENELDDYIIKLNNLQKEYEIQYQELKEKKKELVEYKIKLNNVQKESETHYQELKEKKKELNNKNIELINSLNLQNQVLNSTSWKITKPIRLISETFPYFTKHIYRIIKLIWLLLSFRFKYIYYKSKQKLNIVTIPKEVKNNFFSKVHNNIGQNISPHANQVDIVICVHNAIEDVKRCLSSIIINTNPPYHIILVDDGSSIETKLYLEEFSITQSCTLIRNEEAQGYTKAANKGLVSSLASYVVLLNSDTIIGSTDWLDRMLLCALSDKKIGMISPLSNTASWQSIPEVFSGNDWADNILPDDFSVQEMAKLLAQDSSLIYPTLPFLNGFCLLIKSECISSVGYFDEQAFCEGYGEENDFCLRAIKKGWKLSIADDVYIYHAQSKSYSHSKRVSLSNKAGIALQRKHGQEIINSGVTMCRENIVLFGIRSRAKYYSQISKLKKHCQDSYNGKKILFVLPIAAIGGGGNVIIQEIKALRNMQIDCFIANKLDFKEHFEIAYPKIEIPTIYFENNKDLSNHLDYFDVIIGTAFSSIEWIKKAIAISKSDIITAYYIQDFEPYFFSENSLLRSQALDSYTIIPNIKCFTKTKWNKKEVLKHVGISSEVITPSVNLDIFRPMIEKSFDGTISISAMIRPETPRRSPETTMKLLQSIKLLYGDNVEIYTFGCNELENIIRSYSKTFDFKHFGILNSSQLASLFNNTHIFIDMSLFQAMGLTGMEAMACNNAVILPKHGGANEFIKDSYNGFLVDTIHDEECLKVVDNLMNDRLLLTSIAKEAVKDICQYSPYFSAKNIIEYIFKS